MSTDSNQQTALLALEDGRVFHGVSIGAPGNVVGEICFNTSMTGYQEILTDPSYRGQIVTMTYPLIGNYGTALRISKVHLRMYGDSFLRNFHAFPATGARLRIFRPT